MVTAAATDDDDPTVGLKGQVPDRFVTAEVGGDHACGAEAAVQCAVIVETDEGHVVVGEATVAAHDDPAARLHGHILGDVPLGADRGGELAVAAEGGVQAAVAVVADDAEILLAANDGRADLDDAAGGIQRQPQAFVDRARQVHRLLAVAAEGVVEAAVGQVAGHGEVGGAGAGGAADNDPPVGLDDDPVGHV